MIHAGWHAVQWYNSTQVFLVWLAMFQKERITPLAVFSINLLPK